MFSGCRRHLRPRLSARPLLISLAAALAFGAAQSRAADSSAHDFFYASFYVFAPSGTAPSVAVINKATDEMIGRIALPMVPQAIVVSDSAHQLAAIDGRSNRIVLADLASGATQEIALAIVPQRLWLSSAGSVLAAVDLKRGTIDFIALAEARGRSHLQSTASVAGPSRDALFSGDDAQLFVAADGLDGIGVIDVAKGEMIATIPAPGAGSARFAGLTRSADGAILYAAEKGRSPIRFKEPQTWPQGAIDGGAGIWQASYDKYVVTPIAVVTDAPKIYPTGYGKFLVAPDTLTLLAAGTWKPAAELRGLAAMSSIYSGWFDEVAMVASATEPKLLALDLDRLAPAGEIALPGVPGPGAVTADGAKLYVPIAGADAIAVIDMRNRRLLKTIAVDAAPSAAVVSRSFDVCH